ncbi:hypothetical protein Rxyl_2489 [Rubrobacter xylanophilus DSM 9941]|uniref:Uncharacterized protein n=1 Tax=Rubrobacter xylanophilus (strain DSM 9941 / JCM 11954 / NBRC 16129 / PRD-1) TaxID=266117 RepID=Q1AT64_RUBXD|nr:hypothetical protein Rxyl_2489 [Rubrobacter xylanophilus DSM 9941]
MVSAPSLYSAITYQPSKRTQTPGSGPISRRPSCRRCAACGNRADSWSSLKQEGTELLEDRLDGLNDVWWECGHGAYSFRSRSVENSLDDGASVYASPVDALPINGNS